jgi:transcriptional regulator with XRE-family HTH domain
MAIFATGRWVRAARRVRRRSQRELAVLAGVPPSTVGRIESGASVPKLDMFVRLLGALGYELAVVDRHGCVLTLDDDHDRLRDGGGRRFPAHLDWDETPTYWDCFNPDRRSWWGWERIAWPFGPGKPPTHTYWRRTEPGRLDPSDPRTGEYGRIWDDAT